jgi:hypothetical protein
MPSPAPLPRELGTIFSSAAAIEHGVTSGRLRTGDLARPFRGTRIAPAAEDPGADRFERYRARELTLIRALASRLAEPQFVSHRSAALVWGAPLPYRRDPDLHLSALSPARAPRVRGVTGHTVEPDRCRVVVHDGIPVSSAASTWIMLGALRLSTLELVAAGDYFARQYRSGYGRPDTERPPIATLDELRAVLDLGGWAGAPTLRKACALIREGSWSPQESFVRVHLVWAGLPEPELNLDVFESDGDFIACLDMAYTRYKVGVEYHGMQHGHQYAKDVERMARLRAAGWDIVEVTRALMDRPHVVTHRVETALRRRGWQPGIPVAKGH